MNNYIYHEALIDYKVSEDLQHAINAWVKLGFIVTNVKWVGDNKNPEYNVNGDGDNAFIRKTVNKLQELISAAHETGDFSEILTPRQLAEYIKCVDEKEQTNFFKKYFDQLVQLEHYIKDPSFFEKPMIKITNAKEETDDIPNEKKVTRSTKEKANVLHPTDDELIAKGPRGVTNQGMIPAVQKYVNTKEDEKLLKLKELYPQIFEGSRKYLPKKVQEYLQKQNI